MLEFIRRFRKRNRARESATMRFRPDLLMLEGRITPANAYWVGNGIGNGAKWSVAANWSTNATPGPNDVAIFNATIGNNTDSTMDLGGGAFYHVGKLVIEAQYNKTITLTSDLYVDIFNTVELAGGTIKGTKKFIISQNTGAPAPATMFGNSFWRSGTLEVSQVELYGEMAHSLLLEITTTQGALNLKSDLQISDKWSTVKWTSGNVTVQDGKKVNNRGTFVANSQGGQFGTATVAVQPKWTFENRGLLDGVKGTFRGTTVTNLDKGIQTEPKSEVKKPKGNPEEEGEDQFEIQGEFIQDADAVVSVEGGTLLITGTFTHSDGSVTVADGATLRVTDAYAFSGGTIEANGDGNATLFHVGTFDQTGGDATITATTLQSDSTTTVSGGTLKLAPDSMGTVVATIDSTNDVTIEGSGTLLGVGNVIGNLTNDGTISVGGVVNPPFADPVGTLAVTGDYTQTGSGVLILTIYNASDYDKLAVSGLATLAGTLNVIPPSGVPEITLEGPLDVFEVVTYGSRSGMFGTLTLPPLAAPSYWDGTYYDQVDHPNCLSLWAMTPA